MKNKRKKLKDILNEDDLMLTEEDVNMEEFSCLLPEQRPELIAFVYKISQVLYNSYFEDNELL